MKLICTQKERENMIIELTKLEARLIKLDMECYRHAYGVLRPDSLKLKEVLEEGIKRIEGDESG